MTIKEMFKKINAYNEVAEIMGQSDRVYLGYEDGESLHFAASTEKELREFIKEEYFAWAAKPILNCNGYEFDETNFIMIERPDGATVMSAITFNLYTKRA